jgi:hypothetical protein
MDGQMNIKLLLKKIGNKSIRVTISPQLLALFIKWAKEQSEWCGLKLETEIMLMEEAYRIECAKKWSESFFNSMIERFNISEEEKSEIFEEIE